MAGLEIDRVLAALPALPPRFGDAETAHLRSVLAVLIRAKTIDEIVWAQVLRYARHRAKWDRLVVAIDEVLEEGARPKDGFMSGAEQMLAYHENQCVKIERELIATPYSRIRSGQSAQTNFLDLLAGDGGGDGDGGRVLPFKPMGKRGRQG